MKTFKQHKDSIKRGMNATISTAKELEIVKASNECACDIAGLFPIGGLKDEVTVSPGDRLPSNLVGIIAVRDASDNSIIYRRGEAAVGSDEEFARYYTEIERAPFSEIGLPFKSTGSVGAGASKLTCENIFALASGIYLYRSQIGDTIYQASIDANGNYEYDADGKLILLPIQSSDTDPQLSGVRFYITTETNNDEIVYYGENEDLAYWNHDTYGWIITVLDDVGSTPTNYFDITGDVGEGKGGWAPLYITFESVNEYDAETVDEDDLVGLVVCITNSTYGNYYYRITSINSDDTFDLSGTHPHAETNAVVTIYKEWNQIIRFVDDSEEEVTSGSYTVYYWTIPNPMTQDDDIIPFAYPTYLELLTLRSLPETKNRRPVSKRELDDAQARAKKEEPIEQPPSRPLTAQGSPFSFGSASSEAYSVRGE